MTPAEKIGLKVGDKVRVTGHSGSCFCVGDEIVLEHDDGSSMPRFRKEDTYQWVYLSAIELVKTPSPQ